METFEEGRLSRSRDPNTGTHSTLLCLACLALVKRGNLCMFVKMTKETWNVPCPLPIFVISDICGGVGGGVGRGLVAGISAVGETACAPSRKVFTQPERYTPHCLRGPAMAWFAISSLMTIERCSVPPASRSSATSSRLGSSQTTRKQWTFSSRLNSTCTISTLAEISEIQTNIYTVGS